MPNQIPLGFLSANAPYTFATGTFTSLDYRGAAYANLANAKWFGFGATSVGGSTTTYARSNTLSSGWTTGTMPASRVWGRAANNGSRVVATSNASTSGAYTDNGTTWTSTTMWTANRTTTDIIWDGTRFLALSTSSSEGIAHSTDGATWSRINIGSGGFAIAFDGISRYVLMTDSTSTTALTCTSNPTVPANWSSITMPGVARQWNNVVYGNGTWLATNTNATNCATSNDGVTWTQRFLPVAPSSDTDYRIFFYDGYFYYASDASGSLIIYRSGDGASWSFAYDTADSSGRLTAWAATGTQILAVGESVSTDYYYGVK